MLRSPRSIRFARELRKSQTDVERKLWHCLRSRRFQERKFRRQYPVAGYITDFVCIEAKLVIELDGGQHNEAKQYDDNRTKTLEAKGFKVLRFWDHEVLQNVEAVQQVIFESLTTPSPRPSPASQARETADIDPRP